MVIFPCLAWKAQILYAFTTCLLKRLDRWINRGETGDQRGKWTCSRSHSKRLAENSPGAWSRLFPFHQSAQTAAQLPVILQRTASLLSFCRASGDECRRPGLRLLPEEPGTGRREHSPFPWAQSVVENGQGISSHPPPPLRFLAGGRGPGWESEAKADHSIDTAWPVSLPLPQPGGDEHPPTDTHPSRSPHPLSPWEKASTRLGQEQQSHGF